MVLFLLFWVDIISIGIFMVCGFLLSVCSSLNLLRCGIIMLVMMRLGMCCNVVCRVSMLFVVVCILYFVVSRLVM